jgi:proteasome accessory factor B
VLAQGAYYGLARIRPHADFRMLKLSRIRRAAFTGKMFDSPRRGELREYLNQSFGLWQEEPRNVKIRFDAQTAPAIQAMKIHPSQRIEEKHDGFLVLHLTVSGRQEILWWILQWGEHAELIEPEKWRIELSEVVRRMAARYENMADLTS